MRSRILVLALTAGLGAGTLACAADDDVEFARQAASTGMLEVELGSYAAANAESPEVKRFGMNMVDDHGKANRELADLAQKSGITLPTTMNAEHRAEAGKLMALKGADFDREYVKAMVDGHQKAVSAFSAQADQKRTELDRWAASTLPVIEQHLNHAKELQAGEMPQQVSSNRATE
jgi:putative membrane protein